jgi:hypothetical protein
MGAIDGDVAVFFQDDRCLACFEDQFIAGVDDDLFAGRDVQVLSDRLISVSTRLERQITAN